MPLLLQDRDKGTFKSIVMRYEFVAERKLVFIVSAGGRNRLVEFSDRNENGVAVYKTDDEKMAQAVRKTSMARRGVITETSQLPAEEPKPAEQPTIVLPKRTLQAVVTSQKERTVLEKPAPKPKPRPKAVITPKPEQKVKGKEVSIETKEFDNFTMAREAISKTYGIPKNKLRNPMALDKVAKENGFVIKYKNAEQ